MCTSSVSWLCSTRTRCFGLPSSSRPRTVRPRTWLPTKEVQRTLRRWGFTTGLLRASATGAPSSSAHLSPSIPSAHSQPGHLAVLVPVEHERDLFHSVGKELVSRLRENLASVLAGSLQPQHSIGEYNLGDDARRELVLPDVAAGNIRRDRLRHWKRQVRRDVDLGYLARYVLRIELSQVGQDHHRKTLSWNAKNEGTETDPGSAVRHLIDAEEVADSPAKPIRRGCPIIELPWCK